MPAVSVIIPVYNVEPFVARCARSLFSQTLEDLEFIFVDDCTPDRSMEVIREVLSREFPARESQVRVFRMPVNGGLANARMQGLALATGEYVIHCDGDDELTSPDAYRLLYGKAVAERLDIVTCNYLKEDASGRRALVRGECKGVRDLLLDKAQGCLVVRLIRRTILQDGLLAPRGSMGEDLVQSVQATLRAGATGHLDEPLYLYRYCPVSITKLQGKEAAIRRHRELAANVRMLVDLLVGGYGYREDAPEIVRFKYYARHCIEPYVGDKACYAMWKETFPEVDAKLLANPCLSLEKKGWFILIHLHLYAPVKRLTRPLGKRRGAGMKRILIDKSISDRVLTVGERYWDPVHGGIVSVLKAYRESFETFHFIASSGRLNWAHKLWYDLGGLFALGWRLLWDRRIKIVHIHTAAGRSFDKHAYYAWLARLMGRKVILHSHASRVKVWYEGLSERHQRRVRRMLSKLDRLIVLSSSWRDFFVSIGVSPEKVDIVNNITEPAGREKVAREAGGPVQLLFLGEIGPRKGVFDLLQAMALLQGAAPGKARLEIGGNKNEEALEEAIRTQGLEDCVHFNGFVAGDRKKELLDRAEVFVLPS